MNTNYTKKHGTMIVYRDGQMIFEPDNRNPELRRYETIGRTLHAEVKEYPKSVLVTFKFDRNAGGDKMVDDICEESMNIFGMLKRYN